MPVLALVRSPSVEHGMRHVLVTENGGLGHTSAVYAQDPDVVERFSSAVRTGRILVNAPTAVGALGRDLQLDDADVLPRLRHLGRLEHDRQHQLPQPAQHQDRFAPPGSAAVVSRPLPTPTSTLERSRTCAGYRLRRSCSSPTRIPSSAASRRRCERTSAGRLFAILRYPPGADRGADPGGRRCDLPVRARGDPRRRRRLGPRRCEGNAALPRVPS